MILIDYPPPDFKLKTENGRDYVFDANRKCWILLTQEEWVRQNFIAYLVKKINYPATVIAIEKEIKLGELKKRFDILIYDQSIKPWMMVECKAPSIKLDSMVLQQVLRYNISVPVKYLVITNGGQTIVYKKSNKLEVCDALPSWNTP